MLHRPTGTTTVAAVVGRPVRHSLSPLIFNTAYAATGLDWVYVAFDVAEDEMPAALAGMRAFGLGGLSVTMPGKEAAARLVDERSPAATALGAVNCVVPDGGRLVGHNTDGDGFVDSLRLDLGLDPAGQRFGVLGAGGAARAVIRALAEAGAAEVAVVGRTPERVEVAVSLAAGVARAAREDELVDVAVIVNATPIGMAGTAGTERSGPAAPCDPERLQAGQTVVDLVYHPLETPLLAAARRRGLTAANGVGMLVHQAAHQFRLATGEQPPLAAMQQAVTDHLHDASRGL